MVETENLVDVGYLQDIISYIFDEKKIVTYKWISSVLSIHVNRAKQLLYTFLKHIPEERLKELKVTYLVGGLLPNDKGCRLQIVSEEDLEKVKAHFKVITSEHIYSVSLKHSLSDLLSLCSVDGVKDSKVERYGALRCNKGVARTAQEATSKRQEAYKAIDDGKKWPTAQSNQREKESSAGGNDKKSSKSASSISAMFSAQNSKKKSEDGSTSKKSEDVQKGHTSSPEKKVSAAKNSSNGGKPPVNRLAAMFSAQNTKPKTAKKDVQAENNSESEKEARVSKNDTKADEKIEKKETASKNIQKSSKSKGSKAEKKKSKPKKRKASDNIDDKNKKRKRIVVMDSDSSDSSSDDIFGSDEEEEEEEKIPLVNDEEETEEPIDVAALKEPESLEMETVTHGHRGRKRRLVDKTFEDEEGYIVTKKLYEYVSCSESENEEEKENEKSTESKISKKESEPPPKSVKEKPQKNHIQKKNSPEKKKQATLMNFFKRS